MLKETQQKIIELYKGRLSLEQIREELKLNVSLNYLQTIINYSEYSDKTKTVGERIYSSIFYGGGRQLRKKKRVTV